MQRKFQAGTGIASILMIFVVLCLTTFGVLSYLAARADEKTVTKSDESIKAHYAAVDAMETLLSEVDCVIYNAIESGVSDEAGLYDYLTEYYSDGLDTGRANNNQEYFIYVYEGSLEVMVNVSSTLALDVLLDTSDFTNNTYTITSYRTINTYDWNGGNPTEFGDVITIE